MKTKTDFVTQIIYKEETDAFKRLSHLAKIDRQGAKIFAFNNTTDMSKTVLFLLTKPNSNQFTLLLSINCYSVNRNGKIYAKKKNLYSIIFKDGKAWSTTTDGEKKIKPAAVSELLKGPFQTYVPKLPPNAINAIQQQLDKIPYLNTFKEHQQINGHLTYNNVVRNKILSIKDRITYAMGGIKGEKIIEACNGDTQQAVKLATRLIFLSRQIKPYLYLIDDSKINPEIFNDDSLFLDTLRMAAVFNTQIKLRWSAKRLKEVHDDLSKTITLKSAELDNVDFDISEPITNLAKFINDTTYFKAEIITNSKDLAIHGMEMKHCVGTYTNKIQSGNSQILKVTDTKTNEIWTAELSSYYKPKFSLIQFRGFSNKMPPEQVHNDFKSAVDAYSNSLKNCQEDNQRIENVQTMPLLF